MDVSMLARMQFAANISFHILFPTITIAMGWFLLFFKLRFNYTQDIKWMDAYKFWVKIFALCFALGVVSGITMSFQFGTNWPGYMQTVGNIAGPLLAYEVLTAFFLEATFLGIMLFGFNRVSNKVHTLATVLVAGGTTASAFWIIALNSWMQTPVGFEMIAGKAHAVNWWEIIFNPSMPYRLTHMLIASGITAAFLIAGISAYRWRLNDKSLSVMAAMKTAAYVAAILIPIQIFIGDMHGLNTLKYQPAKIAAMEGIWKTEKDVPLLLFAWPDHTLQKNLFEIKIPFGASLILTHHLHGEVQGIDAFNGVHPPVAPLFFSFRIMVGMGVLMLLIAWVAAWQLHRNQLKISMARALTWMAFSGWIATLAGWYTTEIGRQPWLVHGILMTADARATNVTSGMLTSTLLMYVTLYIILIISFISVVFYLARKGRDAGAPLPEDAFSSSAVVKIVGDK